MVNSFATEIYNSFRNTNGYAIASFSSIVTILSYYFASNIQVTLGSLIVVIGASISICFVLFDTSIRMHSEACNLSNKITDISERGGLPKVIAYRRCNDGVLLLLDQSILFSIGLIASVYQNDGEFEILIGYGYVENVQENKKILIKITNQDDRHAELWEMASKSDSVAKTLIVKPGGQFSFFNTEGSRNV